MDLTNIKLKDDYASQSFTSDQAKAVELIAAWYKSKDLVFTLSGAAGTGKTYILDYLLRNVFTKSVCVTAPTHKAVKVIENVTGRRGKTLQSLHGLRPNTNLETFDLDNIQFDPLGEEHIANFHLIIVDECSQINKAFHEFNLLKAKQYTTKVLYVGDHRQLPPINDNYSPTFDVENIAILNEVVRQKKTNPLLDLLEISKYDVDNGTSELIAKVRELVSKNKQVNITEAGEGYAILNNVDFQSVVLATFNRDEFKKDVTFARYAAWTNSNILVWNTHIRNSIIGEDVPIVHINDLLTGYKTIVDEFASVVISNSDDYFVDTITEKYSDDGFKVFVVRLTSLSTGNSALTSIVDHTDPTFNRFKSKILNLYFNAKYATASERSKNWRKYFMFKDRNLVMIDIPIQDDNRKLDIKKDLDYGYGLTIHKLQGSTFDNIFVNLRDICFYGGSTHKPVKNDRFSPNGIDTRNKLIYTGLSRASKKAVIMW